MLVVGAFSSTEFGVGFLHDRYLFYVVPLWLVLTAWWAARRVPLRPVWLAVGAALTIALLATLPPYLLNDDGGRRFDAIASALPSELANRLASASAPTRWSLVAAALVAVALAIVLARLPRWLVLVPVAVVFALDGALAWDTRIDVARNTTFAPTMDAATTAWVDRAVPDGAGVATLAGGVPVETRDALRLTEFFNASIGPAYDLVSGYAPTLSSTPVRVAGGGLVVADAGRVGARWIVAPSDVELVGDVRVGGHRRRPSALAGPTAGARRPGDAVRARLAGAWKHATDLAGTRRGAVVLVVAALVVFAIQSLGWPVAPGRDLPAYLTVYVDFWNGDPVLPWAMVTRTPVTPLVVGGVLDLGSPVFVVVFAALLFAGTVLLYARTALRFGRGPAVLVGVALLLYPGLGILFHGLAGDVVFAAGFAVWTAIAVEPRFGRPSPGSHCSAPSPRFSC